MSATTDPCTFCDFCPPSSNVDECLSKHIKENDTDLDKLYRAYMILKSWKNDLKCNDPLITKKCASGDLFVDDDGDVLMIDQGDEIDLEYMNKIREDEKKRREHIYIEKLQEKIQKKEDDRQFEAKLTKQIEEELELQREILKKERKKQEQEYEMIKKSRPPTSPEKRKPSQSPPKRRSSRSPPKRRPLFP